MRKLTSKLALLVLAVALAVVALGTTTFAWFTLGGNAQTETVTLDVSSSTGLEISYDGLNYKNTLTMNDFKAAAAVLSDSVTTNNGAATGAGTITNNSGVSGAYSAITLSDVTTEDGIAFYKQVAGVLTAEPSTNHNFLEFNIWVRQTGTGYVKLDATLSSTAKSWLPDATIAADTTTPADGTPTLYAAQSLTSSLTPVNTYAAKAARISITSGTTTIATKIGTTTTTADPDTFPTGAYDATSTTNYGASIDYKNNLALAYDMVKSYAFGTQISGVDFALPDANAVKATNTTGYAYTIPLYAGTSTDTLPATTAVSNISTTSYVVRVWLEGFDYDCFNALLSGNLSVTLAFTAVSHS